MPCPPGVCGFLCSSDDSPSGECDVVSRGFGLHLWTQARSASALSVTANCLQRCDLPVVFTFTTVGKNNLDFHWSSALKFSI